MNFEHALKIEDLGIEFKRFKSGKAEFYICQWDNGHDSHLYSVGIVDQIGRWTANLAIDGRRVGGCDADTRSRCADMAVYAMRAVILRGHRKTLRTLRRAKESAEAKDEAGTPSLSPDEVVTNDDAWQKEYEAAPSSTAKPVAVAAAVVCVLLALPGILMALLGWMAGGVQCP